MNLVTIYPTPEHGSQDWPLGASLSMLIPYEISAYDDERMLYIHIQTYRGTQEWRRHDASAYVPLPNTPQYTTVDRLRRAASFCRAAMISMISLHNERAAVNNSRVLALQAQQQSNDEDEDGDDDDDDDDDEEEEEQEQEEEGVGGGEGEEEDEEDGEDGEEGEEGEEGEKDDDDYDDDDDVAGEAE
ncbi:hypothetical protein ACHAO8_003279 [Botrytis cinerea]